MKKILPLIFCALSLTSCRFFTRPDADVVDNRDERIVAVYAQYLENGGTLTYEEWLASIKGEKGDKGEDAPYDPQGLDFYLRNDGTYAVGIGNALYLSEITIPSKFNGKDVTMIANQFCMIDYDYDLYDFTRTIHIPSSIKVLGQGAFERLSWLGDLYLDFDMTLAQFKTVSFSDDWIEVYTDTTITLNFKDCTKSSTDFFDGITSYVWCDSHQCYNSATINVGQSINLYVQLTYLNSELYFPENMYSELDITIGNTSIIEKDSYSNTGFVAKSAGQTNIVISYQTYSTIFTVTVE